MIDLKDRLSVATVIARLREYGVLEADGLQFAAIRDTLINAGFVTLPSDSVWSRKERGTETKHLEALQILDSLPRTHFSRVLWLCSGTEQRKALKQQLPSLTKRQAGRLLGYPECCIDFDVNIGARAEAAFIEAIIKKVGEDHTAIRQALKTNLEVEIEDEAFESNNVPRTDQKFPFVLHIACDKCLSSDDSPSALLNREYESFAAELDDDFHHILVEIRPPLAQLEHRDSPSNRKILNEVAALHQSLFRQSHR